MLNRVLLLALLAAAALGGQTAENVLVLVNRASDESREIGEYYVERRGVPAENVCDFRILPEETVSVDDYFFLEKKVIKCLEDHPDAARIRYLVTTKGVPLRTSGGGKQVAGSVDSELTLLYRKMRGEEIPLEGPLRNPFFGKYLEAFDPEKHRLYLVTRLTGYTVADAKALVDRALEARNRGLFVFDISPNTAEEGNARIRAAARALPQHRILLDREAAVLYQARGVIGYSGWGSNDKQRLRDQRRWPDFEFLPGAIVTEYVSTDGRSFQEPPSDWRPADWEERTLYHAGSPQSMTGDWIRLGATGASGHTHEPFLAGTPHPNYLFPAYYEGRTLAESYYLAIPFLSWRNIVVGDPLCRLGKPSEE